MGSPTGVHFFFVCCWLVQNGIKGDYTLTYRTGTVSGAGTDASIFYTIVGTSGSSGKTYLPTTGTDGRDIFESDSLDVFEVPDDFGSLQEFHTGHDDQGGTFSTAEWYLYSVDIVDNLRDESFTFTCQCWIPDDAQTQMQTFMAPLPFNPNENILLWDTSLCELGSALGDSVPDTKTTLLQDGNLDTCIDAFPDVSTRRIIIAQKLGSALPITHATVIGRHFVCAPPEGVWLATGSVEDTSNLKSCVAHMEHFAADIIYCRFSCRHDPIDFIAAAMAIFSSGPVSSPARICEIQLH